MMLRPLRRQEFALDAPEVQGLLARGKYGVLATVGPTGYAYGVPLHYVFFNQAIYFHCNGSGHLAQNIKHNQRVSFTVVGDVQVLPAEISANYESVIAFGQANPVGGTEKISALRKLVDKYAAAFTDKGEELIQAQQEITAVFKITVAQASGKRRWQKEN